MEPTQLDVKTREQISYNMSRVRSSGSVIEKELGKALWALGLRYRKQYAKVVGKPDFAIVFARVAVFCDSSFWHGRGWPYTAAEIKSNREFWVPKMERTIARDKEVNKALRQDGWRVLRFWDYQILCNPERCAQKVLSAVRRGH